jgi:hypothetical protein
MMSDPKHQQPDRLDAFRWHVAKMKAREQEHRLKAEKCPTCGSKEHDGYWYGPDEEQPNHPPEFRICGHCMTPWVQQPAVTPAAAVTVEPCVACPRSATSTNGTGGFTNPNPLRDPKDTGQ